MDIKNLIELDATSPKRIAVIGDAIVDVWIHGKLLPSQDGCDKFIQDTRLMTGGGATNARNCLSDWNTITDLHVYEAKSTKTRYLVDGKIVFRIDKDATATPYRIPDISIYDAILLSDYDKGYLTEDFTYYVIKQANELSIPIVADCKRHPDLYAGAILKGNYHYDQHFGPIDIVTRGSKAPIVRGKALEELPPVKCINHVGAGDCFAAHLTLALAYGFSLEDAARVAHKAGHVYVQYPHNRPPRKEEIANVVDTSN